MNDCLFCKIASKKLPASVLYEDAEMIAINDIDPQAPLHALVIPRRHIPTVTDLTPEDDELVGRMLRRAAAIAGEKGYAASGYRTVFNCQRGAGQSVFHLHLHVLGGRNFSWPPG